MTTTLFQQFWGLFPPWEFRASNWGPATITTHLGIQEKETSFSHNLSHNGQIHFHCFFFCNRRKKSQSTQPILHFLCIWLQISVLCILNGLWMYWYYIYWLYFDSRWCILIGFWPYYECILGAPKNCISTKCACLNTFQYSSRSILTEYSCICCIESLRIDFDWILTILWMYFECIKELYFNQMCIFEYISTSQSQYFDQIQSFDSETTLKIPPWCVTFSHVAHFHFVLSCGL